MGKCCLNINYCIKQFKCDLIYLNKVLQLFWDEKSPKTIIICVLNIYYSLWNYWSNYWCVSTLLSTRVKPSLSGSGVTAPNWSQDWFQSNQLIELRLIYQHWTNSAHNHLYFHRSPYQPLDHRSLLRANKRFEVFSEFLHQNITAIEGKF